MAYKLGEVIDIGDDTCVYYQGELVILGQETGLHVVSLRDGDNVTPTGSNKNIRVWCDKCGALMSIKARSCKCWGRKEVKIKPEDKDDQWFLQVNKVDLSGENEDIPAGTVVRILERDDNGIMVETLDKSVAFYVDEVELAETPPYLGGGGMLPGFGQVPTKDGQLTLLDTPTTKKGAKK